MTACKPDTVSDPAAITSPQSSQKEDGKDPADTNTNKPTIPNINPLASETFKPAVEVNPTLSISGFTQCSDPKAALKDQTISLYTASDRAAFNYVNRDGEIVSEWDWMKMMAEGYNFHLKLTVKPAAVSLKTQRVAVYSGKELSLLQFGGQDLAAGMTIAKSAEKFLNSNVETFGISKSVLAQSKNTYFAPVGNVKSLWYNPKLVPADGDPFTLSGENKWALDTFKTASLFAANKGVTPLIMSDDLAWATLSGKSPLTLLDGKLDSNIHSKATREVWDQISALRKEVPASGENNTAALKNSTAAMEFTEAPTLGKNITLKYAPLPAAQTGTAGTVVYSGTFMALPRVEMTEQQTLAALAFAELWCNRFTEARLGALQTLGVSGKNYVNYVAMAEQQGQLIFRSEEIDAAIKPYLAGLSDEAINMESVYESEVKDPLNSLVTRFNLYY
jgi:hypothetical protein